MRRWPTWLVVGALAALGAVAAADALRDSGTRTARPKPPATTTVTPAAEPVEGAMGGVLYYSNADDECRLDGLSLPDLGNAPPPKLRSCRFSLSPDGLTALAGSAAWSPRGGLYARERHGTIELGSPSSRQTLRFPGRAPAFKPDGTFTYVRGNAVVEWTANCPRGSRLFTITGIAPVRCRRVVLAKRDVEKALALDAGIPKDRRFVRSLAVTELAWLGKTRLLAGLSVDVRFVGGRSLVAIFERRRLIGGAILVSEPIEAEPSPRGNFFAVRLGPERLAVRDRNGNSIAFPLLTGVHALTWSPDERWTAVATRHSVYVFRTNEGEARIRRLRIVARELAWR